MFCLHGCMCTMFLVPMKVRTVYHISWNWGYRWLYAGRWTWVLCKDTKDTKDTPTHGVISPTSPHTLHIPLDEAAHLLWVEQDSIWHCLAEPPQLCLCTCRAQGDPHQGSAVGPVTRTVCGGSHLSHQCLLSNTGSNKGKAWWSGSDTGEEVKGGKERRDGGEGMAASSYSLLGKIEKERGERA